jgi:hypothetical protein
MKITIKNIIWFTKESWKYVTTKKLSSKILFFIGFPKAFYVFFIREDRVAH